MSFIKSYQACLEKAGVQPTEAKTLSGLIALVSCALLEQQSAFSPDEAYEAASSGLEALGLLPINAQFEYSLSGHGNLVTEVHVKGAEEAFSTPFLLMVYAWTAIQAGLQLEEQLADKLFMKACQELKVNPKAVNQASSMMLTLIDQEGPSTQLH